MAYLRLSPECSHCGASISWRHPFLELGNGALIAALWLCCDPGNHIVLYTIYSSLLILLAVIDMETHRIPRFILYPGWGLAILGSFAHPSAGFWQLALLGSMVGSALLFIVHLLGKLFAAAVSRLRGNGIGAVAFGFGDVGLGTLIGLIVGYPGIAAALLLAVLLGGLTALTIIFVRAATARRYTPFKSFAYGPFLVAAALMTLLFHSPMR